MIFFDEKRVFFSTAKLIKKNQDKKFVHLNFFLYFCNLNVTIWYINKVNE